MPPQIGHIQVTVQLQDWDGMIGEALEIMIVVSMLVLVGYPSTMMAMGALQERRRRRFEVVEDRRRPDKR